MLKFSCFISWVLLASCISGLPAVPTIVNWDSVFAYTFDYERVQNYTNRVTRRVTFSTAAHFRQDIENPNSVLAFFEEPIYDHDDAYHRNQYFIKDKLEGILMPFRINYYRTGLVHNIYTDFDDTDLSAKFKKTLASLMQIDWGFITAMTDRHEFDYNFTTPEVTIFGDCDVRNTVTQVGEGRIVTKDILLETCIRNKPYSQSSVRVEFKFRSSRDRTFHLVTLNGIEYVPESDSYSKLTQRLEFVENVKSRINIDSRRLTVDRVIVL